MAKYIATYDLKETNPKPHATFLVQAEKLGWVTWIKGSSGKWYRLPNTTLVGEFTDLETAVAALKNTRAATERELGIKVTMEKWIVAQRETSQFDSNETQ